MIVSCQAICFEHQIHSLEVTLVLLFLRATPDSHVQGKTLDFWASLPLQETGSLHDSSTLPSQDVEHSKFQHLVGPDLLSKLFAKVISKQVNAE